MVFPFRKWTPDADEVRFFKIVSLNFKFFQHGYKIVSSGNFKICRIFLNNTYNLKRHKKNPSPHRASGVYFLMRKSPTNCERV